MRTLLRDELDQFLSELSLHCHSGLHLNAEQVHKFASRVGAWRDLAKEMEFLISKQGWNLAARADALQAMAERLDKTEAMLRNSDSLADYTNAILDEVDRPGSNVRLLCPSITGQKDGVA